MTMRSGHRTKMAPTVTRSQPNSIFGMWCPFSCPGCASHKSPSTARRCCPINMGQQSAFRTLLNQCHVEIRQFWRVNDTWCCSW